MRAALGLRALAPSAYRARIVFPIRAENPVYSRPVVTWLIVGLNLAVFLAMKSGGDAAFQRHMYEYATIPYTLSHPDLTVLMAAGTPVAAITGKGEVIPYDPRVDVSEITVSRTSDGPRYQYRGFIGLRAVSPRIHPWLTLLTSMFMHAGWLHLLGNMWFLWVFGASVEDLLGKLGFAAFYLACGLAASAAHLLTDLGSIVVFLGASGAIAGVMGGFALRFPRAQVLTVVPLLGFWTTMHLPAILYLVIYLGEQVLMSFLSPSGSGGVAWWAHIGGFLAGFILIRLFPTSPIWHAALSRRRPSARRFGYEYDDIDRSRW